jgi:hypothetical protein
LSTSPGTSPSPVAFFFLISLIVSSTTLYKNSGSLIYDRPGIRTNWVTIKGLVLT